MEKSPKVNEPKGEFQEINSMYSQIRLAGWKKSWKRINGVYLFKSRILKIRLFDRKSLQFQIYPGEA